MARIRLQKRWDDYDVELIASFVASSGASPDDHPSPFRLTEAGSVDLRGFPLYCRVPSAFECVDFDHVGFTSAETNAHRFRFVGCSVRDSIFDRADMRGLADFGFLVDPGRDSVEVVSTFERCSFVRTRLERCSFGGKTLAGRFVDCVFDRASFNGYSFLGPVDFDSCTFLSCKTAAMQIVGARFRDSTISGVLTNVRFVPHEFGRRPSFENVDMTAAEISFIDIQDPLVMDIRFPEDHLILDPDISVSEIVAAATVPEAAREGVRRFETMYRDPWGWSLNSYEWLDEWLGAPAAKAVIRLFAD